MNMHVAHAVQLPRLVLDTDQLYPLKRFVYADL